MSCAIRRRQAQSKATELWFVVEGTQAAQVVRTSEEPTDPTVGLENGDPRWICHVSVGYLYVYIYIH